MLTCESLFLLLTTPKGESEAWSNHRDLGLAGALLADLGTHGWIDYGEGEDPIVRAVDHHEHGARGAATVTRTDTGTAVSPDAGAAPPPVASGRLSEPRHPVLRFGVHALREHPGSRASEVIAAPWFRPTGIIVEALAHRGIIAPETGRLFGLLPARYPTTDPEPEAKLRASLRAVLNFELPATPQLAAILVLLREVGAAHRVLTPTEFEGDEDQLEARIAQVVARMHANDPPVAALSQAMYSLQALLARTAVLHF